MADFNWLTEDEEDWPQESVESRPHKERPSWLYPLLMVIIIGISGTAIYSLIVRRAEAAEEAIKEDVRRTHELVMNAAEAGDVELFTTFLSGADVRWQNAQIESVRRERFNESSWLGFYLEGERPYRLDEITLSPDLDEAVVLYTRWYENRDQVSGTVPLQQTAVYRRGGDRWLLAPPKDDFWGDTGTFQDGPITFSFPERDENHVLRITDNILASIPEICNSLPAKSCPDGWRLRIDLSYDPETIINPTAISGPMSALELSLPTPSLIGAPLDGSGYNLMYENYRQVLWRRLSFSMTTFVAERPEFAPPFLKTVRQEDVPDETLTFSCSTANLGRVAWHVFQFDLASGRWDVTFTREYKGEDSGLVLPLAGGKSYAIQEFLRSDLLTSRLLLWEDGETVLVGEQTVNFDTALTAPFFLREEDPTGRFMVVGMVYEDQDTWNLLDRETCLDGESCRLQPVISSPIWSPDGSQMLLLDTSYVYEIFEPVYRALYRADFMGQNPVEVGLGISPFWLDSTTYGYSRLNDEQEVELVLADSADDTARVWLRTADLIPLVPNERRWSQLSIWNVWVNPADPEMVVLMTTPGGYHGDGPYDFFMVKGTDETPQIEWLFSNNFPASTGISPFSPDGRYLLVPQRGTAIDFRNLETGESILFDNAFGAFSGWTPDSSYYYQRTDEALTFTNPANGSEFQLIYDFSTCSGIQWLDN